MLELGASGATGAPGAGGGGGGGGVMVKYCAIGSQGRCSKQNVLKLTSNFVLTLINYFALNICVTTTQS